MSPNLGFQASVVADSINQWGQRLITFQTKYPRFIHAEVLTHRMLSRNSTSSRAIPVKKLIDKIIEDPAMPVYWGKNKRGMQAGGEIENVEGAKHDWICARNQAVMVAQKFSNVYELHKQIANRILEPWMHIEVIITATERDNFYKLRRHKDAQPEIKKLADLMWEAEEASTPKELKEGEWHLPYIDWATSQEFSLEECKKISVARCARVSYTTHTGEINPEKDMKLHDYLVAQDPKHFSPTEHQGTPVQGRWGNFKGWKQYRQFLEEAA